MNKLEYLNDIVVHMVSGEDVYKQFLEEMNSVVTACVLLDYNIVSKNSTVSFSKHDKAITFMFIPSHIDKKMRYYCEFSGMDDWGEYHHRLNCESEDFRIVFAKIKEWL